MKKGLFIAGIVTTAIAVILLLISIVAMSMDVNSAAFSYNENGYITKDGNALYAGNKVEMSGTIQNLKIEGDRVSFEIKYQKPQQGKYLLLDILFKGNKSLVNPYSDGDSVLVKGVVTSQTGDVSMFFGERKQYIEITSVEGDSSALFPLVLCLGSLLPLLGGVLMIILGAVLGRKKNPGAYPNQTVQPGTYPGHQYPDYSSQNLYSNTPKPPPPPSAPPERL